MVFIQNKNRDVQRNYTHALHATTELCRLPIPPFDEPVKQIQKQISMKFFVKFGASTNDIYAV